MALVKRPCSFRGKCATLTEVDSPMDLEVLGMFQTKWCDKHVEQYRREQKVLAKLVPEYNKKKLVGKNGRIITFDHGTDVSNYLFRYGKKRELNKILKRAQNGDIDNTPLFVEAEN